MSFSKTFPVFGLKIFSKRCCKYSFMPSPPQRPLHFRGEGVVEKTEEFVSPAKGPLEHSLWASELDLYCGHGLGKPSQVDEFWTKKRTAELIEWMILKKLTFIKLIPLLTLYDFEPKKSECYLYLPHFVEESATARVGSQVTHTWRAFHGQCLF